MRFEIDHTHTQTADALNMLQAEPEISIDTETTGLEETDRLFCVTLSTPEHQVYVDKDYVHHLRPITDDPHKTWFLQNAKFDMRMLRNAGIELRGIVSDNSVMARLVRNDHMKYNLASQASRYGMAKLDVVEKEIASKKLYELRPRRVGPPEKSPRFDWVDRELLKVYACADAEVTFKLAKKYQAEFSSDMGNHWAVWNNECALTKVCFEMERRGIALNLPYVEAGLKHELETAEALKATYTSATGVDFVDSGKSFGEVFTRLGLPVATTAKGNPSFTDDILDKYQHPVAELIRDIRSAQKTAATYYTNFINMHHQGVIHPTMWQAGTRTGRFSYSDPNLQNLTKDKATSLDKYLVRGCFTPRAGKIFLSMDYKAVEYRMMLAYAEQRDLIAKVMAGEDVHQATADLLGIDRQSAKTLNFAILYGAGVEKLAQMLRISKREAQQFKDMYFMKLPKVERFIDEVIRVGRARGFVHNWLGRRLYAEKEFCYALPNHLIQGGSADVIKVAMVQIGKDEPMLLQIHDQLVFEINKEDLEEKTTLYKSAMENAFPEMNGMRLTVDVQWSDKSLAERDMVPA